MSFHPILKHFNEEHLVELTRSLVNIPSVTGEEGDIAEFIVNKMERIGLEVKVYEAEPGRPNVIGRLRGEVGKPVLIFNGHMDVVPIGEKSSWSVNPFSGEVIDAKIYGRGTADMKGGLAAMLETLNIIKEANVKINGDIVLEAVIDEENGGYKGTGKLASENAVQGDFAVVGEPTNLEIQIAHKGVIGVEIVVNGKSAHASTPHLGVNAIHKMINVISALLSAPERFKWNNKTHRLVGSPLISVSVIEGGIQRNIIPDRCRVIIDRRVVPNETIENAKAEVNLVLEELLRADPELNVNMKTILEIEPMEISDDALIVKKLKDAVQKVLHTTPILSGCVGFCDAHWLVNQCKIPTVIFGPGRIDEAHTINEYISIDQLIKATKIYTQLVIDLLS
jgi:acetylornithine deacetylase/succinyl-diaminopimelate desuccinylase family protein